MIINGEHYNSVDLGDPDAHLPKEFLDWFEESVFNAVQERMNEIRNDPNMSQEVKDILTGDNRNKE